MKILIGGLECVLFSYPGLSDLIHGSISAPGMTRWLCDIAFRWGPDLNHWFSGGVCEEGALESVSLSVN